MADLDQNQHNQQTPEVDPFAGLTMPKVSQIAVDTVTSLFPGANQQEKRQNLDQCSSALGKLFSIVPGVATLSIMLNATTRAAHWLGTADWGAKLEDGLGLSKVDTSGYEKEASKLETSIETLRKNAPELKEIAEEITKMREQLKKMKENPDGFDKAQAAKLEKRMHGYLRTLSERLDENSETMDEVRTQHKTLLAKMRSDLKAEGKSTEEIDAILEPMTKSIANRELLHDQMLATAIEALEGVRELRGTFADTIEEQIAEYRKHAKGHGHCDKGIIERFEKLAESHRDKMLDIEERLEQLKERLTEKRPGANTAQSFGQLVEELDDFNTQATTEGKKLSGEKRDSLLEMGVASDVIQAMEERDKSVWGIFTSLVSKVVGAFEELHHACQSYVKAEQVYIDNHVEFLRSRSASFHGGAGYQQLSLGLFDGPYALSALSFMAEHEKQLKGVRSMLDPDEASSSQNERTNMYSQKDEKTTDDFYADFLKTETTFEESILPTSARGRAAEREKDEYERRTGSTVVGELSASQKLVQETTKILQKDRRTFLQPVGNKTEKDIVSS